MSPEAPRAAYRLQLRPGFGLAEAAELAPYLRRLGMSHVYTSPVWEAEPGSEHGYDVVDPTRVRDELGGDAALDMFVTALAAHDLRWMLDIVPNHVSVASHRNRWWWDVCRVGPASPHAATFDVDWRGDPPHVVLPILGDELDAVVARGELIVDAVDGEPVVRYWDRLLPIAPGTGPVAPGPVTPELLARQHYRLVHWRRGATERNYRCFFDIAGLAGVRMEDPRVFAATHARLAEWVGAGYLDALRVDHVDGLADPLGYLDQLRALAPSAWIVVEKILAGDERLRATWPVDGTTGYEFARVVTAMNIDPAAGPVLDTLYTSFTGAPEWGAVEWAAKREVVSERLATDVARTGRRLAALAGRVLPWRPLSVEAATAVVAEALTSFDVYRTYVRPGHDAEPEDLARVSAAMGRVRTRAPELEPELVDLVEEALSGRVTGDDAAAFVTGFQQLGGPVTAKGVEDTALYRYVRLVALNQVGGEPHRLGEPAWVFHRRNAETARSWPRTLLTASTHDSKRSHDVRTRLSLLSECPGAWSDAVRRWHDHLDRHRRDGVPGPGAEYLLYQTLVGAWPPDAERLADYLRKAAREAGLATSWFSPDEEYEARLVGFVDAALADEWFTADLAAFVEPLVHPGRVLSLAETLLRLTAPGVPDLYQGNEVWDLSLVDPDNRRPVDFADLDRRLAGVEGLGPAEVMAGIDEGLPRLWMVPRVLAHRAAHPDWFAGSYQPLYARGERRAHVVAFRRGAGAITVVPRLVLSLAGRWADTDLTLPPGSWRDVLGGTGPHHGTVRLDEVLAAFPAALLIRSDEE